MYKYFSKLVLLVFAIIGVAAVFAPFTVAAAPVTPQLFAVEVPVVNPKDSITCTPPDAHPIKYDGSTDKLVCCPTTTKNPPTGMTCFFEKYANPIINLLSAGAGIIIIIGIIIGGIQYSSAGGDPGKVSKAKERIRDALIALAAFIFLFSILQWVIPGGLAF